MEMRYLSPKGHVPRCDEDGSFAEIQCYPEVKKCWCVDKHGRERNGTRQTGNPTNCNTNDQGKKYVKLRSVGVGWGGGWWSSYDGI